MSALPIKSCDPTIIDRVFFFTMDELPNPPREPSEIIDLAAVPRPIQQRVHIVVQVDWFQIAEKFLPRPDEETDIRDLTVASCCHDH